MSNTKTGLAADLPPAGAARGRTYIGSDTNQVWVSDGVEWIETTDLSGGGGGGIEFLGSEFLVNDQTLGPIVGPRLDILEIDVDGGDGTREVEFELNIPSCWTDEPRDVTIWVNDGTDSYGFLTRNITELVSHQILAKAVVPPYEGEKTWTLEWDAQGGATLDLGTINGATDRVVTLSARLL